MADWRAWLQRVTTWDLLAEIALLVAILIGGLVLYLRSR